MLASLKKVAAILLVVGLVPASAAHAQFGNPGLNSNFGSASFGGSSYGLGTSTGWSPGSFGTRNLGTSLSPRTRTFASGYSGIQTNNFANLGQFHAYPGFNQTNRLGQPGEGLPYASDSANTNSGGLVNPDSGQGNLGWNAYYLPNGSDYGPPQQPDNGRAKNATSATTRKADIEYPSLPEAVLSSALTSYLERSLSGRIIEALTAAVQGRTLILRGAVATEHDRALAERLALLEPGVESVRNELLVRPKSGAELPPPK